mmetsp:Transcript_30470/g.99500  ORF Transcript_30470/g.99500 Transcript_30470/m.99500 type:complete len:217 (-) Transcript_30470:415-1065(-)
MGLHVPGANRLKVGVLRHDTTTREQLRPQQAEVVTGGLIALALPLGFVFRRTHTWLVKWSLERNHTAENGATEACEDEDDEDKDEVELCLRIEACVAKLVLGVLADADDKDKVHVNKDKGQGDRVEQSIDLWKQLDHDARVVFPLGKLLPVLRILVGEVAHADSAHQVAHCLDQVQDAQCPQHRRHGRAQRHLGRHVPTHVTVGILPPIALWERRI